MELSLNNDLIKYVSRIDYDILGLTLPYVKQEQLDVNTLKISLSFQLETELQQDDWQLRVYPAFTPSFHWAPHLTPTNNHIIDQHSFRSPALIMQDAGKTVIVIPDLDIMRKGTPVRWYMDMNAEENALTLGMSNSKVTEHVLFERAAGANYPQGIVEVGLYILVFEEKAMILNPWRHILRFLWERWGHESSRNGNPIDGSLEPYVDHTYKWAFDTWEDSVWQEFNLNGKRVGAPVFIVNITQSPNYPGIADEREFRSIWNQVWFSSLRSAQGLFRYGKHKKNEAMIQRALMTKELALSAPQMQGFFPAVIATEMERLTVNDQVVNQSKGWETYYWGNSNRNPQYPGGSPKDAPYHVLDMGWTALLMLTWYEDLEKDARLLQYANHYAEALVKLQDEKGYFPAWLDQYTLMPLGELQESPETSLSVTFLLKLYELIPKEEFLAAALKAMRIVMKEIIPEGRWEDFETYWSCCTFGQQEGVGKKIIRNNMYKQCNFSMFWTAEALYQCFIITKDPEYLHLGERCLDEMLMTQASWQPPYMFVNVLGGFGVMNCDGEWNDSRQSLFAELIIQYGIELNRPEYIERGVAALRSSYVMMYCPENERTKQQWEEAYPFFKEEDYGFMMENYGHSGETGPNGEGMGVFTIYDWGNGAAAESYMRIKERYGHQVELSN
jgi:hypothetical protein